MKSLFAVCAVAFVATSAKADYDASQLWSKLGGIGKITQVICTVLFFRKKNGNYLRFLLYFCRADVCVFARPSWSKKLSACTKLTLLRGIGLVRESFEMQAIIMLLLTRLVANPVQLPKAAYINLTAPAHYVALCVQLYRWSLLSI